MSWLSDLRAEQEEKRLASPAFLAQMRKNLQEWYEKAKADIRQEREDQIEETARKFGFDDATVDVILGR